MRRVDARQFRVTPTLPDDASIHLIALSGELDLANVGELRRRADRALVNGSAHLVVDLTDVTHMDSTGLAELIALHQRTTDLRGGLALVVTSRGIRRTLEIRGVDHLFIVTASPEEARAALRRGADLD
jgi:anti-sigma B factor antagonist